MPTNAFNFGPILDAVLANTKLILENQGKILINQSTMELKLSEDFTAFTQAVADLRDEVMAIGTQMDTLFADLTAALGTGNQPAVDAATAALRTQIDALRAAGTRDMPPVPAGP